LRGKNVKIKSLWFLTEYHVKKAYWGSRIIAPHWIGGSVGPTAILDAVVKRKISSPYRESNPRTSIVQPVA
jgi:hypothetical protein